MRKKKRFGDGGMTRTHTVDSRLPQGEPVEPMNYRGLSKAKFLRNSSAVKSKADDLPIEGLLTRGQTAGVGIGALMPDFSREAPDADKPRDYPGEGLKKKAGGAIKKHRGDGVAKRGLTKGVFR